MPRFPSAQGRLNHEPDSTLAVTKTCPKDGVHLCLLDAYLTCVALHGGCAILRLEALHPQNLR